MHMHYLCIYKIHEGLQRTITLTELATSSPYFSIINVNLEDIHVFARSDEIPSLPVQDTKENGRMVVKTVYPLKQCVGGIMKVLLCPQHFFLHVYGKNFQQSRASNSEANSWI